MLFQELGWRGLPCLTLLGLAWLGMAWLDMAWLGLASWGTGGGGGDHSNQDSVSYIFWVVGWYVVGGMGKIQIPIQQLEAQCPGLDIPSCRSGRLYYDVSIQRFSCEGAFWGHRGAPPFPSVRRHQGSKWLFGPASAASALEKAVPACFGAASYVVNYVSYHTFVILLISCWAPANQHFAVRAFTESNHYCTPRHLPHY